MLEQEQVEAAKATIDGIVGNVDSVIQGKHEVVELVVQTMVAGGHVLLEDLPGTGKTTLATTLAASIDCDVKRIQFTPDVMPSDIVGFTFYNQKTKEFEFHDGAANTNIVVADEINRASPKTQSAMLEVMAERNVTVDGTTYKLPEPFMVMATQNPLDQVGTYALPAAQMDRFAVMLTMGYPSFGQEATMLKLGDDAKLALRPVASGDQVTGLSALAKSVHVDDMVIGYIMQIVTASRNNAEVLIGSSPRGGIALLALARARALSQGRGYVLPDDVKALAPPVLRHRISLSHEAKSNGRTPDDVISALLGGIDVPKVAQK